MSGIGFQTDEKHISLNKSTREMDSLVFIDNVTAAGLIAAAEAILMQLSDWRCLETCQ